jgi:hypothetical protein
MKLCRYCNKYYPETEFGIALTTQRKIYRRHKCKSCYRNAKEKLRKKYRDWLVNYKKEHRCSKCRIADYRVLEFHHLDNKGKEFTIATAFYNHYGLRRIQTEIKKCIVICANCHRILHYKNNKKIRTENSAIRV